MAFSLSAGRHNSALSHCRPEAHTELVWSLLLPQLRLPPSYMPPSESPIRPDACIHPTRPAAPTARADRITCTAQQAADPASSLSPPTQNTEPQLPPAGTPAPPVPPLVLGGQMPGGSLLGLPHLSKGPLCPPGSGNLLCHLFPRAQHLPGHKSGFKVHPASARSKTEDTRNPRLRCPTRQLTCDVQVSIT